MKIKMFNNDKYNNIASENEQYCENEQYFSLTISALKLLKNLHKSFIITII